MHICTTPIWKRLFFLCWYRFSTTRNFFFVLLLQAPRPQLEVGYKVQFIIYQLFRTEEDGKEEETY